MNRDHKVSVYMKMVELHGAKKVIALLLRIVEELRRTVDELRAAQLAAERGGK